MPGLQRFADSRYENGVRGIGGYGVGILSV